MKWIAAIGRRLRRAGATDHRLEAALAIVDEWQREGGPNAYMTRMYWALRPPEAGEPKR
jgi:hypothetical protein